MGILSLLIFLPVIGSIVLLFLPKEKEYHIRAIAFAFTIVTLFTGIRTLILFDSSLAGFQLVEIKEWIPNLGAKYHLGIDGISILLVLLTVFLSPICVLASSAITKSVKSFHISLLLLETAMLGVFLSLDVLLFYIFWEFMLIPMAIFIGIWGSGNRIYAAIKFFLFTMAGSVFLLFGLIALYIIHYKHTGILSLYLPDFYNTHSHLGKLFFLFISFGFAIKVPLWPFHTWLPDAHTEAPTAGSVILAGILLKMGVYGFLRIAIPVFPEESQYFAPYILGLSIIGIIFGGLVAMKQSDVKRLVAYSSVSHLGFVMLGVFSFNLQGITGSIIQMINHGINTGLLFLLVGMIYERRHTREIADINGLAVSMPRYSSIFVITTLASMALPGTNGFIGEFLCLVGGFKYNPLSGFLASLGVIVSAMYLLLVNQKVIFGRPTGNNVNLKDLSIREWIVLVPLVSFIFLIGLYPLPFIKLIETTILEYVK
ncbi:MAG: NADH-quinone oxidoreductase subunit M [Candidatus Hydrogenedentota bacterium]